MLQDLKRSFLQYIAFYHEWSIYKYSGLNELDLYMLKVHFENNFEVDSDNLIMFYNNPVEIKKLTKKLDENYTFFQEWLILKFQMEVLKLAGDMPLELFFNTSFYVSSDESFYPTRISNDLLLILKKFGHRNFSMLFQCNSEKDFMKKEKFEIIVEFMTVLKIEITIYQSLKKEVKSINRNCSIN